MSRKSLSVLTALVVLVVLASGILFPGRQRVWRLALSAKDEITIHKQRHILEPVCSFDLSAIPIGNLDPDDGFAGRFSCYLIVRAVGLGYVPTDLRADSVWFTLGPLAYGTSVIQDKYSAFHDLPDRRIWIVDKGPVWLQPIPFTVYFRLYDSRGRAYVVRKTGVTVDIFG